MTPFFFPATWARLLSAATKAQKEVLAKISQLPDTELLPALAQSPVVEAEPTALPQAPQSQFDHSQQRYTALMMAYNQNINTLADIASAICPANIETPPQQLPGEPQNIRPPLSQKPLVMYQGLNTKTQQAIEAMALAKGYGYLLDDTTGQVLYVRQEIPPGDATLNEE